MKLERTPEGLVAELRVNGFGRFVSAAFLCFWLAIWAAGEAFVLWILSVGTWAILTGQPPEAGRDLLKLETALPVGFFLLFWLTIWTIGGIAAFCEFLRLLSGRDRFRVLHDGLEVEHRYGLFRSRKKLKRDELQRLYQMPGSSALRVATIHGTTELTRLGTPAQRAELEQALNAEFKLSAESDSAALPKDWCEVVSRERDSVLVKDPVVRRKQARFTWIVFAVFSMILFYLFLETPGRPKLLGTALFIGALTAAIGWGGIWLSLGRSEWRMGNGRLVLQRRFGQNRTPRFEAVSLELIENSSDGDRSYSLMAIAAGAPERSLSHIGSKHRRSIQTKSDDSTEPRNFGLWLSKRCNLPFADLTTAQAKAIDLEHLKQQLANSGRFGRIAVRIVERLGPPTQRPGR